MRTYIGTKTIKAEPAAKDGRDGYKVVYPDGYESWSPKDVFEAAYKVADTWLDRLRIERDELNGRLQLLGKFIDGTEAFKTLDKEAAELLLDQRNAMAAYLDVLDRRIAKAEQ